MRIIYYIEPLTEMEKPYWRKGWLSGFVEPQVKSILSAGGLCVDDVKIVVSDSILSQYSGELDRGMFVSFNQSELTNSFKWDQYDLSMHWYADLNEADSIRQYYLDLFKRSLGEFSPDVIVSFSPCPFLKDLFPKARVLYLEYGFVSRPPFPPTYFFDPVGTGGGAYLAKHWKQLAPKYTPEKSTEEGFELLRGDFRELVTTKTPLNRDAYAESSAGFRKTVLFPLQFSRAACCDALSCYRSQLNRLEHFLQSAPQDVGVIFTTHPEYPLREEDQLQELRRKYKNLLYLDKIDTYYSSSILFFPYVDAVMGTSWSVACQGLLWGLPVIPWDNKQLETVLEIPSLFGGKLDDSHFRADVENSEKLVKFMMEKFCFGREQLGDGKWLLRFFGRLHSENAEGLFDEAVPDAIEKYRQLDVEIFPLRRKVLGYEAQREKVYRLEVEAAPRIEKIRNLEKEIRSLEKKIRSLKRLISRQEEQYVRVLKYVKSNPVWFLKMVLARIFKRADR